MSDKCNLYRLDDFRKKSVNNVPSFTADELQLITEEEFQLAEDLLKSEEIAIKLRIDLLRVQIIDLATRNPLAAERLSMYVGEIYRQLMEKSND